MRRLLAMLALVLLLASRAAGGVVIQAKVNGTLETIGMLEASINAKNQAQVIGVFSLDAKFKCLDERYDFQWVNVETRYENPVGTNQANDPVLGKLPAIDPQPKPTNPKEDNKPFYYNDGEWLPAGKEFGGFIIHDEGKASRFVDRPSDGTKDSLIFFTTYLVVDNISDPKFPKETFSVLGSFDWQYANKGKAADGVATVTRVGGTPSIGDADVNLINTGIANAGKDGFGAWKAVRDAELTCAPGPSTFLLAVVGLGALGARRVRRRAA